MPSFDKMSGQSLINDEDRAALDKMTVEGDVSDSTLNVDVVKASIAEEKKKSMFIGPPKPDNRDGMGRYKVPPGGKPLTVNDIPGPGPGAYEADYKSVLKRYPQWTLGEKDNDGLNKGTPGPNKYNTSGDMKWGKCKTITMKNRFEIRDERMWYPGVGAYDITDNLLTGPKYTMRPKPVSALVPGLCSKFAYQADPRNPGPDFNISSCEWLQKPKSFGVNPPKSHKTIGPGPHKYFYKEKRKGPKWTIGEKIPTTKQRVLPSPGPQAYTLKSSIGEAPKFSFGIRFPPYQSKFTTPGPNVYNRAGVRLDEPGFTMKYRWFEPRKEKRPGPYTWKDDLVRKKSPSYSMFNKVKPTYPSSVYSNFREDGPAPNEYDIPRDLPMNGKTFGIKYRDMAIREVSAGNLSSPLKELISQEPGPPDYQDTDVLKVSYRRAPSYSIAGKTAKKFETMPGPGHYNVRYQENVHGKTFGIKTDKKSHSQGPDTLFEPLDPYKLCRPCECPPGATLKSRHTPHKYTGMKNSSLIPPQPKNFPQAPLLG